MHLTYHRSSRPLELIHSDIWSPAPLFSFSGNKYFLIFIDDYFLFTWYYPIKCKSEVATIFHQFKTMAEKQLGYSIKSFNLDWGGEYRPLHKYFNDNGILHRITCPHTHEQNGTAERKIRNIVDTGLALLGHSGAPFKYWEFAFETAVFLINRMPTSSLQNKIPYSILFNKSPDYTFLKVFGCAVYPLLRPYNTNKFSFRSKQCVFLGYSPNHLGYRCLDKDLGKMYVARHVEFDEKFFPFHHPKLNLDSSSVTMPTSPWFHIIHQLPPSTRSSTSSGLKCSSPLSSLSQSSISLSPTSSQ